MTVYSIVGQKHRGFDSHLVGILPGTPVTLVREPDNKFDPNAVMVWIDGKHVGYIPSKENKALAEFIDQTGFPSQWEESDSVMVNVRNAINAKFIRSPNSAYPMVEV